MINFIDVWVRRNELVLSALRQNTMMCFQRELGKINFTKQQARLIWIGSQKLNITFDALVFESRLNFDYHIDQLIKPSHLKPGIMHCAGYQKILFKLRSIKGYCISIIILCLCCGDAIYKDSRNATKQALCTSTNVVDLFWVIED